MRGARPKDPGRRVGLPTEDTRKRHQQSSSVKHLHAQSYLDYRGNHHPLTQDDENWTVAGGFRNRNRGEANRGRPYRANAMTHHHGNHYSTSTTTYGDFRRESRTKGKGRVGDFAPTPNRPPNYQLDGGRCHYAETKPIVKPLNMNDLKKIHQTQSPNDVVHMLSNRADMLKALLNEKKINNDVTEILLRIFVRVFEYKTSKKVSEKIKAVIDMLKDSTFFKSVLQLYTANLGDKSNTKNPSQIEKKIALLSIFLRGFIPGPECEVKDLEMHITLLDASSKALFVQRNLSQEAVIEVARLKKEVDKCITEAKEEDKKRRQHASAIREGIFDGPPPDDYRDIPILPTKDDLQSMEPPFLRPNKTKGSYSNHIHYLDVQFRLLREDFIGPLRDGIQTHLANVANPLPRNQRKRNTDVRLYYDVQIDHPVISENGVHYRVKFSLGNLTRVKWQNTKRLIFGSLVCLSHDNFQTLVFGTVGNREEELLRHGRVDLKIHNIENVENTRVYTMVESTAFFESYRPVLQVLQQFNEESIPMENYIIRASHNIEQPKYLRNKSGLMYDISSLMKQEIRTYNRDRRRPMGLRHENRINILDDNAWPEFNKLTLDESQLSAVKAALTKELAVIQGPPGTGKTYIGLKIVETLLRNKSHWSPNNDEYAEYVEHKSPIMVICYTNHALDQFLEGILEFSPKKLVRIGGRSKSEELARFNLRVLSKKCRRRSDNFKKIIDAISDQMIQAEEMIKLCNKYILSEYTLEAVINENHFRCLQDSREEYLVDGNRSTLPTWLGLLSTSDEFEKTEDVADADDEIKEEQGDVSNTKNITTEFDMLMYQREYDDTSDRKDYETRKKSVLRTLYTKLAYNQEMKCRDSPLKEHYATLIKQLSITDDEMDEQEANRLVNIRKLSLNNRWRLYRYWLTQYKGTLRKILFNQQHSYDQLVGRRIHEQDHEAKCEVIRDADVVGMTTTGAAMNKELLNAIRPKIVIVEEAAEILEAHIVTSLTNQCEHLILIGDHQQLKPNPTVYKLATKFHLDTSLFERMLTNDVPCQRLSSQHRMRPEISNIMRKHFYSHLLDDDSVNHFDNVMGVSHNLFFINHDIKEESVEDILSKSNVHEAEYCLALANYFFQQGYEASCITILTTYTGQVLNLKGKLRDKRYACLGGIYVTAVDNYQGEENDIILLSLVRSNEAGNIGFLKVSNRMCVALSRARKGLFCIGNFTLLAEKNDLWMKIVNDMRSSGRIENHLLLHCHNHPATKVKAFIAKDFEKCPLGGCNRMCETRLECGHVCPKYCHPKDPHHEKYECREPCVRTCDRSHPCNYLCFIKCPPCTVIVSKALLDCSHEANIQCAKYNQPIDCMEPCERTLKCGHICRLKCFESCTSRRCLEIVNKSFDPCGHDIQVECYINSCQLPCEKLLTCGHVCQEKCGYMCTTKCKKLTDKTFQCGHTVNVPCFTPSCILPCPRERLCGHPCPGLCGEPCGDCLVEVRKELPCRHLKMLFCYENVESVTCKKMCTKTLPCEHPCKLKCYEMCDATLCTKLVKKKLKCEHEKEVPCNVNLETLYKEKDRHSRYESLVTRATFLRSKFSRLPKQMELLNCNVEVILTLGCGHEITIECYESSNIDKIKCKIKVIETLDCGHDVTRECSKIGVCFEMCSRLLSCGHKCKEACANPCTSQCTEIVKKKLKCGHNKTVKCYVDVTENVTEGEAACNFKIKVQLPCGHEETQLCCRSHLPIICSNRCSKKLSCGHFCTKKCSKECSIDSCKQACTAILACGHKCKGNCTECSHGRAHSTCLQICRKTLICGHVCQQTCSITPCSPCKKQCNSTCPHRKCRRACAEMCEPCKSPCEWKCPHLKCTNACDEMCNRERCNEPCHKTLRCKHKCLGLCGEPCLRSCLKCDPARYDPATAKGNRPKYVYLYDCSHAVEVLKMDAYMDTVEGLQRKECPICHTIIRYSTRYGNVLKNIDVKIASMKRMMFAERSMQQVQERRKQIIDKLSVLKTIDPRKLLDEVNSRYGVSYDRMLVINIVITILEKIEFIRIDLNQQNDNIGSQLSNRHISQQLDKVEKIVLNFTNSVSRQVLVDLYSDLQRLNTCTQLRNREYQGNTTSEDSTKINNMLSIMLYTKIPVTLETSLDAFSLIGPESVEELSKETLDVVEKIVNTGSSFCQDTWKTCAMGHILARNGNEGNVQNCPECNTSKIFETTQQFNQSRGFSENTKVVNQNVHEKGVRNLNQVDNRDLKVDNNQNQKILSKNQRRRQQRQIQQEPKNENVNKGLKVSTDTRTSSHPQRQGKDSPFNNMNVERTRRSHQQQSSSAQSGSKAINKNVSKKTEKLQDERKKESNKAVYSTSQGRNSTNQTRKPPAEGESTRTKQRQQSSSAHTGTKASNKNVDNQPEHFRDERTKENNKAVSSTTQGSKSTNQTSKPANPRRRNRSRGRGRGRGSSFKN